MLSALGKLRVTLVCAGEVPSHCLSHTAQRSEGAPFPIPKNPVKSLSPNLRYKQTLVKILNNLKRALQCPNLLVDIIPP